LDVWYAGCELVPRYDGLAYFSALYWCPNNREKKTTLFSIIERVKEAAMAQYRDSLLPKGVG
jgi:hypothetical protein